MSNPVDSQQTIRGYDLIGVIGYGPFGTVYRAVQPGFERDVAIKLIRSEYANRPDFIRRFEVDCQLIARLEHPNIAPLYDYWREPDGAYLIMPHFASSLSMVLASGPLALEQLTRLVEQVTGALVVAHQNGVVHGNLKPANILFDQDGAAHIADFGVLHMLNGHSADLLPDSSAYLAPEQRNDQAITPQTDVYRLGGVLYTALTGHPPADPSAPLTLTFDTEDSPHGYSRELAAALTDILRKAMDPDPGARYAGVPDLAGAFLAALATHWPAAPHPGSRMLAPPDTDFAQQVAASALDRFIKGAAGIRWRFEREIENPYKGLRPFEEADADHFFGRTALTEKLIARLTDGGLFARFLAVVGPSGSGKSSVVKAGMIAALRRGALPGSEHWFIVEMTPRYQPFDELKTALLSVADRQEPDILATLLKDEQGLTRVVRALFDENDELVLVIDQFEEIFTLLDDAKRVKHFLNLLYAAVTDPASRLRVIITLRADFYDQPLMHPHFCDLISDRTEIVPPMTAIELRHAIVTPLEQIQVSWEPELVTKMVAEVKDQPGTLPLLQYALTELFERREKNMITVAAYNAIGGILGALARRADEIYQGLTPAQQQATRQLFLRLVRLGEGTEDTRRQALRAELLSLNEAVMPEVLTILGQSRLLTFDHDSTTRAPTVEVAHEAIIREWQRLRMWLDDNRDNLRFQRRLATAAREWQLSGRDTSFLISGSRLEQLEDWAETTDLALSKDERDFYQASVAERDRQLQQEAERQARERALEARVRRNWRAVAVISTVGVILAVVLATIALIQGQRARSASRDSARSAEISREIALLSNAQLALYRYSDTDLAIALALEAHDMGYLPDQEYRVLTETMYAPGTRLLFDGHAGHVYGLDLSQEGSRMLSGAADGTVRLWEVGTGAEQHRFEGHTDEVMDVVFSPDERLAASASRDGTVRIWDLETGETVRVIEGESDFLTVVFHPDEPVIAAGAEDRTVRLWDLETGELLRTFGPDDPDTEAIEGHPGWVRGLTFSPDGRYLVSSGESGRVLQWDLESGAVVRSFGEARRAYKTVFSADGKTLFGATFENDVPIWDFETGELILTLRGHTAAVFSVALGPEEKTILTASQDGSVRLWDLETGAELHRFWGHSDWVFDVAFLPGGERFVSSSYDSTLRLWDIKTDQMLRRLDGHPDTIYQVVFNADGSRLLSASRDQTARLWDVETGELIRTFGPDDPTTDAVEGHADGVISVAFSPDGKRILSGDLSSVMILWDAETGEVIRVFPRDDPATEAIEGHLITPESPSAILSLWYVAFAPDGKTAFSAAFDETIIQWDLETGAIIRRFVGHTDGVLGVTLFSDGQRFLSHSWDKTIVLWDVKTGKPLRAYLGHDNWIWSVALSPDEKTFLSASADTTMILWDVESGKALRHFLGHEDSVLSVDFSPDGQWAVSSGRDKRVTLWNVQTGAWLRHFGGHANWVRAIDYSPTEDVFATGDNDGVIMLWQQASMEEMVEWARENRYVRDLTCEERETYRVSPLCSDVNPSTDQP